MLSDNLQAFQDELEKIAFEMPGAVPELLERPGLSETTGLWGANTDNAKVWREQPIAAQHYRVPKEGTSLLMEDRAHFAKAFGPHADFARRVVRQHELTHWLRAQRGEQMQQPGVRGVLRNVQGEIAAHLTPIRARWTPPVRAFELAAGLVPGVLSSTANAYQNYPGGVTGALMGGKLGRVIKAITRR